MWKTFPTPFLRRNNCDGNGSIGMLALRRIANTYFDSMIWFGFFFLLARFEIHFSSFTCQWTTCSTQLSVNDSRQLKQSTAFLMRTVDSRSLSHSTNCFSPSRTARSTKSHLLSALRIYTMYSFVVAEWTWPNAKSIFFWPLKLKLDFQSNEWIRRKGSASPAANDRRECKHMAKSSFVINGVVIALKWKRKFGLVTRRTHTHHCGVHFSTCAAVAAHSFDDDFFFLLFRCRDRTSIIFLLLCVRNPTQGSIHCFWPLFTFCLWSVPPFIFSLAPNEPISRLAESKYERVCIENKFKSFFFCVCLFNGHSIDSKVTIFLLCLLLFRLDSSHLQKTKLLLPWIL